MVTILVQPIVTAVIYRKVWRQAVHFSHVVLTLLNDSLKRAAFGHWGACIATFFYRNVLIE